MNANEQSLGRWIVPVTEDELSAWISCPRYVLPRPGVDLASLDDLGKVSLGLVSDLKDDWLLVVYQAAEAKSRDGVPFSSVVELLGMTDRKLALIENHYAGFGPEIKTATVEQQMTFDRSWRTARIETLSVDCEHGANGLAELMGITRKIKRTYGRKVAEYLVAEELEQIPDSFPLHLFSYSRSSERTISPLGGAFCDLGCILRICIDEGRGNLVTEFAKRVGGLFGSGKEVTPNDILKMSKECKNLPEFKLRFVLFLKWKYATERHGGAIDFHEIVEDFAWFSQLKGLKAELEAAVYLYGAFVGFKSFAVQYHLRVRETRCSCLGVYN